MLIALFIFLCCVTTLVMHLLTCYAAAHFNFSPYEFNTAEIAVWFVGFVGLVSSWVFYYKLLLGA